MTQRQQYLQKAGLIQPKHSVFAQHELPVILTTGIQLKNYKLNIVTAYNPKINVSQN